ncbi:MAG: hypothetical protein QOH49_2322 [Acidobacteriota bacterium]|jgi:hypothetical protein|nr:hypothetical protein [Acidobacteriota bacterium]
MNENTARPTKRALLIGINDYPNLPSYSQLRGCVNDVEAMKQVLEQTFQFPPENIVVLRDAAATVQGIRTAMEDLCAACGDGDIIVFHYSGHGSRMVAQGDKPMGFDESIMPHDSGRMNSKFPIQVEPCDIRDTEIQEWLTRLAEKTSHITLIFDSCHSGSITRLGDDSAEEGTRLRWIPPDPPPPGISLAGGAAQTRADARAAEGSGWLSLGNKYVLLAACAPEQGAYELDDVGSGAPLRHGALTFYLTREIENAPANSTYLDIWERVAVNVNQRFKNQTPLIEGTRDRVIFDVQDFAPMRYLLVTGRAGADAWLAGGAVHGLTVGSEWEVYPAGTKQLVDEKATSRGSLKVTEVKSIGAKAQIVAETYPGAITAQMRAVETVHVDAEPRMPVWLAPAPPAYEQEVADLRRVLQQSSLLMLTEAPRGARAEVCIAFDAAGVATWQVFDRSRALLMSPCAVHAETSKFIITENLETAWRFEKVLELRNERSALEGKIDFFLLQEDAAGHWQQVPRADKPVYRAGDRIAFGVTNRSGASVHVSVLDLGLSKRIDVLYPPHSASEEVASTRSGGAEAGANASGQLVIGTQAPDHIALSFPTQLKFLTAEGDAPVRGTEYFKLVATTQRHDLNFLRQSGLRKNAPGEPQHPLEKLLYLATYGARTREASMQLTPQDEWFVTELAFWLERND